jgi:hypothetical protein
METQEKRCVRMPAAMQCYASVAYASIKEDHCTCAMLDMIVMIPPQGL